MYEGGKTMPESSTNGAIIQPNPYAGGQPAPPISMPGQGLQSSPGGSSSNNSQGSGQNTIIIDDEVTFSGPSTGLNGTPQQSGPSQGGNVQPTNQGTDFNNTVLGMEQGANGSGQNQSSGNATGWWKNGNGWYYIEPGTNSQAKGWKKIDGFWYYFNEKSGIMSIGWVKTKEKWYYLYPFAGADEGKMLTGWQYINNEWYYLETDGGTGEMNVGWKKDGDNTWYYFFPDGPMAHDGWVNINEKWYWFNSKGVMQAEIIIDYQGKKYYVNEKGAMITSADAEEIVYDGVTYKGIIYKGVTYKVDEDGVCTALSVERPADANMQSWKAYIESTLELSQTCKIILLAGIACLERRCVYHQLRENFRKPDKCMGGCDGEKHPWQGNEEYDYYSMAAYNIKEPIYLDCSYFVKHCYWKAGIEMDCSSTEGMSTRADFIPTTKDELKPADIAVKGGYEDVKVNGKWEQEWKNGHVIVFVGYTSTNEMVWIEMGSHGNDRKFTSKTLGAEYRLKKYKYDF